MVKRRQRRPVDRKAAHWGPEDDWELLGLLDLCIKHRRVFPFTEGNVVGRLRSTTSPQDIYTWDQINRRLGKLWHNHGSYESHKADIYVEGSACLGLLSVDEQSTIKSNVERLEMELKLVCLDPLFEFYQARFMLSLHQKSLRKTGLKVPVTRETPSASPLTIDWGQSHTPDRDTTDRERLTPRAQRHQTRELAKQSNWKRESPDDGLCEDETPRKKTRRIKKGVRRDIKRSMKKIADCLWHDV
jgi:hypothetical protein